MPSVSSYNPNVSIHETEEESRYFQVFSERMVHEFSGFFEGTVSSSFWTRLVLQESHNVKSIRHAVIALGALSKSYDNTPRPHLKVNIIQDIDRRHHEQAVLQHLKAIQALNQYISSSDSPQLRNALITCLLFVCFEIFQSSCVAAVQQIYGGLKILQSYYTGKSGARPAAHRRPFTFQAGSVSGSEALLSTWAVSVGCVDMKQDTVIASHMEEYLGAESSPRLDFEFDPPSPQRASSEPPVVTQESYEAMMISGESGAYFDYQPPIQRAMSMYVPEDHLDVPPGFVPRITLQPLDQPDLTDLSRQLNSPSGSSTRAVSPFGNTFPPTPITGHLTPSSQIPSSSSRKRPASTRSPTRISTPAPPLLQGDVKIEDILVQTFVRLDGQGLLAGLVCKILSLKFWF